MEWTMKKITIAVSAVAGMMMLSGCAAEVAYYPVHPYGYAYNVYPGYGPYAYNAYPYAYGRYAYNGYRYGRGYYYR